MDVAEMRLSSSPRRAAFAERFRSVRDARGLVQAEVAAILKVQQQTIARWESGSGAPQRRLWSSVADFLGLTVEELRALLAAGVDNLYVLRPVVASSGEATTTDPGDLRRRTIEAAVSIAETAAKRLAAGAGPEPALLSATQLISDLLKELG